MIRAQVGRIPTLFPQGQSPGPAATKSRHVRNAQGGEKHERDVSIQAALMLPQTPLVIAGPARSAVTASRPGFSLEALT